MISTEIPQILVLGGGVAKDGTLGFLSVERAERAAQYITEYGAEHVVFSGGTSWLETHDATPRSEAEMMAEMAVNLGVPESLIVCEDKSTNTLTNIARSRELLDTDQPIGIVTHEFHLPRTLRIARKLLGTEPEPITTETNYPQLLPHEIIASGMSTLVLWGLHQGDCEEAIRRNDALQARLHRTKTLLPSALTPGLHQESM